MVLVRDVLPNDTWPVLDSLVGEEHQVVNGARARSMRGNSTGADNTQRLIRVIERLDEELVAARRRERGESMP